MPEILSEVRNGLVRIAIAYTGDFEYPGKGPFKITAKDLENMKARLAEREAPIDYEHLSTVAGVPPGWTKAAGWIRKPDEIMEFSDGDKGGSRAAPTRKVLWAWAEFTPVMLAMIKQKEYRYFSPEIHWSEKDEAGNGIGTVLKAAAITNRPFLKELPPIELSDSDYQQLFGLAAREDSKLPAISLSERTEALVSLDQIHVPGPVNQEPGARSQESGPGISVAFEQPQKEKSMKNLKCKRLTDGEHKGKIGVFDGDEMVGLTDGLEACDVKAAEALFASEVGMAGKPLAEIALVVKRGLEAPAAADPFVALSEAIHDGKLNLTEAGKLADSHKVTFSTILLAQEAEKSVNRAVAQGKVLPKNRSHALTLALSDAGAFKALIEEAKPVVDLKTRGHAGGGEAATAHQALMTEVKAYAEEHKCPVSVALSEVTKAKPELWTKYNEETVVAIQAAEDKDEE